MAAGFTRFEITRRADIYQGAPQASSAAQFGTVGVNFRARRPETEAEWMTAINALTCRTSLD